jgi:predicted TIM-barrel fold metal-dependent hydrolase
MRNVQSLSKDDFSPYKHTSASLSRGDLKNFCISPNIERIMLSVFSFLLILLLSYSPVIAQTPPPKILLKNYRPHSVFHIPQTHIKKAKYSVIDVHAHPRPGNVSQPFPPDSKYTVAGWIKKMNEVGVKKTIILTYSTGARFDSLYKAYAGRYPNRFVMFCGIDYTGYKKPGWAKKIKKELIRDHKEGARGIGELGDKGRGLVYSWPTKANGMHIDDPRMNPVLEEAGKLHMPVSIHIADPMWMYEPMDSTNDGLMNAYNWRETNKKGLDHVQLIQTLINAVKKHPNTTFIACHLANLIYNLPKLGKMLDKYPNLYIGLAARYQELATIPRVAKKFITKYQNRIMFGTDFSMATSVKAYRVDFRILESSDDHFYTDYEYHWPLYGLDLGDEVLKKVYHKNAIRILGIKL